MMKNTRYVYMNKKILLFQTQSQSATRDLFGNPQKTKLTVTYCMKNDRQRATHAKSLKIFNKNYEPQASVQTLVYVQGLTAVSGEETDLLTTK